MNKTELNFTLHYITLLCHINTIGLLRKTGNNIIGI